MGKLPDSRDSDLDYTRSYGEVLIEKGSRKKSQEQMAKGADFRNGYSFIMPQSSNYLPKEMEKLSSMSSLAESYGTTAGPHKK